MAIDTPVTTTNKKFKQDDIVAARKWFKEQLKTLSSKGKISDTRYRAKSPVDYLGNMLYFKYDPKHKDTLPYYDTFPLIIVIDIKKDGFLGLNLHYLPPTLRKQFILAIMASLNNTKMDRTTKLDIDYSILVAAAKYKYFQPCLKRYLYSHIKSKINIVRPAQWPKAIMLPVAKFVKASSAQVWKESKLKIR